MKYFIYSSILLITILCVLFISSLYTFTVDRREWNFERFSTFQQEDITWSEIIPEDLDRRDFNDLINGFVLAPGYKFIGYNEYRNAVFELYGDFNQNRDLSFEDVIYWQSVYYQSFELYMENIFIAMLKHI